jgi:hypothetical protein
MPNTYLNERKITGGIETVSPQVTLPDGMDSLTLSLTSSEWVANTGLGSLTWGVEASFDGGTNWILMGGSTAQFGFLNKGTLMPSIGLSNLDHMVGAIWRLFVFPTITIRLGLQGDFAKWRFH